MDSHSTCPYKRQEVEETLRTIQEQFKNFQALLEQNNQVLKVISDMEEKSHGEYLFDLNYIRLSLEKVRRGIGEIIEQMIMLGGQRYEPMRSSFAAIDAEISQLLPGNRTLEETPYILWFEQLGREHALCVGSKNAQLGELRSQLGLDVPRGFAITAWAYKQFLATENLQERIHGRINQLDIRRHSALVEVSDAIRQMVVSCPVPEELSEAILSSYDELAARGGTDRVAVRSSGIGEDSLFSFAGQYATFLNVGRDRIVDCYRKVVASKFTPQAIYYFLSHSLVEADLEMSVGCVEMVDPVASGVIYTRNPVTPDEDSLLIHSVLGLGESLVDGTLIPDMFKMSRSGGALLESSVAQKRARLAMDEGGGTVKRTVSEAAGDEPSLTPEALGRLVEIGLSVEAHYGCPQDIEWALDGHDRIYILQTRPLHVMNYVTELPLPDRAAYDILLEGGTTACPGAGAGPVFKVMSSRDLSGLPDGIVLVAPTPFPGLITAMGKAKAIITEMGGVASHMATLAREFRIPTLVGLRDASSLPEGLIVTVDATRGLIANGHQQDLVAAHRAAGIHLFEDTPLFKGFRKILAMVAPLNLLHTTDPDFTLDSCRTLHDITRFAHQMAMEEMFCVASSLENTEKIGLQLRSEIPLPVNILFLDRSMDDFDFKRGLDQSEIDSVPMKAFWSGMREQGWPRGPDMGEEGGLPSALATTAATRMDDSFAVKSYAILSKTYMMLCLHLGYHFTTVEALCTEETSKNFIRFQHKDGGASMERRIRRIRLVESLLTHLGFESTSRADFLDASLAYADADSIMEKLRLMGRISLMTKQLDMALSNDAITRWYTKDFLRTLGLEGRR